MEGTVLPRAGRETGPDRAADLALRLHMPQFFPLHHLSRYGTFKRLLTENLKWEHLTVLPSQFPAL
jgi:hypothetical protein